MHFYSLGTHGKKNMGRPGGHPLGSGVPTGVSSALLAHNFACKVYL